LQLARLQHIDHSTMAAIYVFAQTAKYPTSECTVIARGSGFLREMSRKQ
jgi:hypothetical protein